MIGEQKIFYIGQAHPSIAPGNSPRSRHSYAVGNETRTSFLGNEAELYGYLKALTSVFMGVRFVPRFPRGHYFYDFKGAEPLRGHVLERIQGSFPHNF